MLLLKNDERGINWVFARMEVLGENCQQQQFISFVNDNSIWYAESTGLNDSALVLTTLVNYYDEVFSTTRYFNISSQKATPILQHELNIEKNCDVDTNNIKEISICQPTQTVTDQDKKAFCKGDIVFEDNFDDDGLNHQFWIPEIRHSLYQEVEEFVFYNDSEKTSFQKNGILHIWPVIPEGTLDKKQGSLHINERCTPTYMHSNNECGLTVISPHDVLPPVHSAQVSTKNSFRFKYGRVDVKAKLPKGDWLFPYVMLVPDGRGKAAQIRIAYIRGNDHVLDNNRDDIGGRNLYGGSVIWIDNKRDATLCHTQLKEHLGDGFHLYSLTWSNEGLQLSVDGTQYCTVTENLKFLQQKLYIVFGVSAGGHFEFANIPNKPWVDTSPFAALHFWRNRTVWRDSWKGGQGLEIDYVKVIAI